MKMIVLGKWMMLASGLVAWTLTAAVDEAVVKTALEQGILPGNAGATTFTAVYNEVEAADAAADAAWRKLKSKADYDAYRTAMQAKFVAAIGGFPARCDLKARTTETVKRTGYSVEKVVFESEPGVYVTANLYLPDPAKFKPPYKAFLITCGHSGYGKGEEDYSRACVMASQYGFASLIYDPIGQGERTQDPPTGNCAGHNRYGALAALLGKATARQRIWDGMRCMDYLDTRADIAHDGYGYMGNSGGGTMTSLIEALDPRVKAAAPSCYLTTIRAVYKAMGPQDAEQNVFGQLAFGLNHASLVLMGGNAVRMHCCHNDMFPYEGSCDTWRVVAETVANCGLDAEAYGMTDVPGPHGWKESARASSIAWMRRWLLGDRTALPIDLAACRRLDYGYDWRKVDCGLGSKQHPVTEKCDVRTIPGFRSVYAYLRDDLDAALKGRAKRTPAETAAVVRRRAAIRPRAEVGCTRTVLTQAEQGGVTVVRQVFQFDRGIAVPAVTFTPRETTAEPVLVVTDMRRVDSLKTACAFLEEGHPVMVADLLGTGEIGHMKHSFYNARNPDEEAAVMLYALGRSLVGDRAEEILALAADLKGRFNRTVRLRAHGRPAISAAHAYAADPALFLGVETTNPPRSWTEAVRNADSYLFANVVHGALLDYDWTDLIADAAPEKPVVVDQLGLRAKLAAAAAAGGGRVVVPAGTWRTGALRLASNVELHLEQGATLLFTDDPCAYLPFVETCWQGEEMKNYSPLVFASGATNVAITGKGTLKCPIGRWPGMVKKGLRRPQFFQFNRCANVRMEEVRIVGTPFWTIHLYRTQDAVLRGLDVSAFDDEGRACMNSDGVDVECSRRVLVENCTFAQDDDSIVVKSGRDDAGRRVNIPSEDVEVRNCRIRAGHTLVGIGSEVAGGVRNVRVHDCTVDGAVNTLLFVKTNAKRGGFMENILLENVRAATVRGDVFSLSANYWYTPGPKVKRFHRTPIRGVTVRNVTCESAGNLVKLYGDAALPVDGVTVEGVRAKTVKGTHLAAVNVKNLVVDGKKVEAKLGVKDIPHVGGQESDLP